MNGMNGHVSVRTLATALARGFRAWALYLNTPVQGLAPTLRERTRAFIEDPRFDTAIILVIVLNAITFGLETSPAIVERYEPLLHAFDRTAIGIFVVEWVCACSSTGADSSTIPGACSIS